MLEDAKLLQFYIGLTWRQRQVTQLVSEGLSNAEIGQRLFIAPCTVASHLSQVYGELGLLDEMAHNEPNRYMLIHLFARFFSRFPQLDNFATDV